MNGVLSKAVIGWSVLLFAAGAFAQGYGGSPVERALYDLNRVSSYGYRDRGDMRRINKAREELSEFQNKWARGRFDKGELNDAIGAIQHVVNSNRISGRDASMLQQDLYRLREFRAQHRYGYGR